MPDDGLSKRAELIAHLSELDQIIEDQTANLQFALEMSRLVSIITERLERLKQVRHVYLSTLEHSLGESFGGDEPGNSH